MMFLRGVTYRTLSRGDVIIISALNTLIAAIVRACLFKPQPRPSVPPGVAVGGGNHRAHHDHYRRPAPGLIVTAGGRGVGLTCGNSHEAVTNLFDNLLANPLL